MIEEVSSGKLQASITNCYRSGMNFDPSAKAVP